VGIDLVRAAGPLAVYIAPAAVPAERAARRIPFFMPVLGSAARRVNVRFVSMMPFGRATWKPILGGAARKPVFSGAARRINVGLVAMRPFRGAARKPILGSAAGGINVVLVAAPGVSPAGGWGSVMLFVVAHFNLLQFRACG
jgi:hypothetical protein